MIEWIKAEQGLPPHDGFYLVRTKDNHGIFVECEAHYGGFGFKKRRILNVVVPDYMAEPDFWAYIPTEKKKYGKQV